MSDAAQTSGSGERRSRAHRCPATAVVLLAALVAACGGDGGNGGGAPTPTPGETPGVTPTAAPTGAPTPGTIAQIAPMILRAPGAMPLGFARGVNAREWIAIFAVRNGSPSTHVVLPPDAGPDAGPLPVPGCPLGAGSDACELAGSILMQVGETDWVFGSAPVELPSFTVSFPAVFGPAGEAELVIDCCGRSSPANDVLPLPGAHFLGNLDDVAPSHPEAGKRRPILWPAPGPDFELLPVADFDRGVAAYGGDAEGRIAGQGGDPPRPIVWVPDGDGGFDVVVLPLAAGDSRGGAADVDGGSVVGFSGTRAVVWEPLAAGWDAPLPLPMPGDAISCTAVAISGPRVVGNCELASADSRALSWRRDGDGWRVEAILLPVPGVTQSLVRALSGDLAVGDSVAPRLPPTQGTPVAWRLP